MILTQKRLSWSLTQTVAFIWGGAMVAGILAAVIERAPIPGFLLLALSIPLSFITALLAALLVASLVSSVKVEQLWAQLLTAIPFAFMAGAIAGAIGIWNDGSGAVALAPGDAFIFVVTGGILPLGVGPLAVVRVATLVCCVSFVLILRARNVPSARAAIAGVASWIVASVVMLSESWIILAASLARSLAFQNALDATRIAGTLFTSSYWTSFQPDRFFASIGQQIPSASLLAGAALMFLCGIVALKFIFIQTLAQRAVAAIALTKRMIGRAFLLLLSPALAGFLIGGRALRLTWNGLDILAALVALTVISSWFMWWHFGRDIEDLATDESANPDRPLPSGIVQLDELQALRSILVIIALVGSFLLGWPILAITFALFVVTSLASGTSFGWSAHPTWRIPVWGVVALLITVFGGVIGARGPVIPRMVVGAGIVWGIVAGITVWQKKRPSASAFWLRYGFFVLLIAGWAASLLLLR